MDAATITEEVEQCAEGKNYDQIAPKPRKALENAGLLVYLRSKYQWVVCRGIPEIDEALQAQGRYSNKQKDKLNHLVKKFYQNNGRKEICNTNFVLDVCLA